MPIDDAMIDLISQYVECSTYEECKLFLQKHTALIDSEVADSLIEKAFMIWNEHPHAIAERFVRNGQILQYLLDLRKVSNGQQDITLFFYRIQNDDKSFLIMFENQCKEIVSRIDAYWKRQADAK